MLNKVVVITGASSGIGEALAKVLVSQGAKVVLAARREAELQRVAAGLGPNAFPVITDVTKRGDVEKLLAASIQKFGHVDVWVNNAGRGISRPVSELTDEDVDEMMTVNVKSALYGMQVALGHLKERKSGHIINVSSVLSRVPFAPMRSAYSASKHALNALSANLRMELRTSFPGITVSTMFPGLVATEFGLNARGGGMDNRKIPGAQPVEEVAQVLATLIQQPRAEVYSRPEYQQQVVAYFSAPDIATVEAATAMPIPPRPA